MYDSTMRCGIVLFCRLIKNVGLKTHSNRHKTEQKRIVTQFCPPKVREHVRQARHTDTMFQLVPSRQTHLLRKH